MAAPESSNRPPQTPSGGPAVAEGRAAASILVERRGGVARVIINRPPLNILNIETIRTLNRQLNELFSEPAIQLIEIGGAGEKAFSTGNDIREHFPDRAPAMLQEFHALIRAALYAPRPTVAVVRGHCLGGGMELALACDFILASDDARFGQPEIKLGAFPPVAAALLPRLLPGKRALEMVLTGESITANQALQLGLVNRVVASPHLDSAAREFSDVLLNQSPLVLGLARKAARLGSRQTFESALRETERIYLNELLPSQDATEGLQAFLEKRPPRWGGR